MGVPGSEKRRLSRQVLVRLPPDAAAKIAEIARTEGITSASWMRRVADHRPGRIGQINSARGAAGEGEAYITGHSNHVCYRDSPDFAPASPRRPTLWSAAQR